MRFYSETLGLSDKAFTILRDLIHERTGLFYEDGKRDQMADKLSPLVIESGFESFLDYYYLLKYDDNADSQWKRLIDVLSVQETYFWREIDQVKALAEVLTPRYFASHTWEPFRIWSMACSTGEEPLTIAMALNEAGWLNRRPIEIYAADFSPGAIAKARKGLYRERSFRALPSHLRARYFEAEKDAWRISPELHSRIKWLSVNLMQEEDVTRLPAPAVVFCRNVFIYFSDAAIRKAVRTFHQHMTSPGYLCIGSAESILKLTTGFELQEIGGAFIYVKDGD